VACQEGHLIGKKYCFGNLGRISGRPTESSLNWKMAITVLDKNYRSQWNVRRWHAWL